MVVALILGVLALAVVLVILDVLSWLGAMVVVLVGLMVAVVLGERLGGTPPGVDRAPRD